MSFPGMLWGVLQHDDSELNGSKLTFMKFLTLLKSSGQYQGHLQAWINFTNVSRATFVHEDPKSIKRHWLHDYLFALLGSASIKAAHKHVDEIEPGFL